jgi:hypothetical protein
MKKIRILILIVFVLPICLWSQSSRFGIKLGPTMGTQRWNYFQNGPLYKYHGAIWLESYSENDPYSIFGQLGYHIKGSATRYRSPITFQSTTYQLPTDEFIFRNASALVGFKKKFLKTSNSSYYSIGLRGEYTISTNLSAYKQINELVPVYPFDDAVRKFLVGATFGAGLDFKINEFVGAILELNIAPDISRQYFQPQLNNIVDIFQPGATTSIPEKSIRNLAVEISLGIHFLRKVTYID